MDNDQKMPESAGAVHFRYDGSSIWLHWVSAALALALWVLGQNIDSFARGDPRVVARSFHIVLGCLLGLVLLYRIWWRSTLGNSPPSIKTSRWDRVVKMLHFGLYVMLVATVVAGLTNVWVRGDNIFHLVAVPEFDPGNKLLREQVEDLHALLANILLAGAALHAVAGLFHHVVLRDGVLQRMLHGE